MENATKALLIAAAVLVAILIISLGVGIFQMGEEASSGANLSEQEVMAFNQKFEQYGGNGKRGSEVNALLKTVVQHNIQKNAEGEAGLMVEVVDNTDNDADIGETDTPATVPTVDTSRVYDVTVTLDTNSGLVSQITISNVTT